MPQTVPTVRPRRYLMCRPTYVAVRYRTNPWMDPTAPCVLDDRTVAYLPDAFSPGSRATLRRLFPDAVTAAPADAAVLGLNAVGDGRHVILPAQATGLARALRDRSYGTIGVDRSEPRKAGGGPKCRTLEVRG